MYVYIDIKVKHKKQVWSFLCTSSEVTWYINPAPHFTPSVPCCSHHLEVQSKMADKPGMAEWGLHSWIYFNIYLYIVYRKGFIYIVLFYSSLCLKKRMEWMFIMSFVRSDAEGLDAGRRESCQGLSVTLAAWLRSWLNIMFRTCKSSSSVLWDIR